MQYLFVSIITVFFCMSSVAYEGSIHDLISLKSDGSIYFSKRYDIGQTSSNDLSRIIEKWYDENLLNMGFESRYKLLNAEKGVFLFKVVENRPPEPYFGNALSDYEEVECLAFYDFKFIAYNGKLKLIMDNMFTKIKGVDKDSIPFLQIVTMEDTYAEVRQFEKLIAESCRTERLKELKILEGDVARLKRQLEKSKKGQKKRYEDLKTRLEQKEAKIILMKEDIHLNKLVFEDVKEKVDYNKLFQVDNWLEISTNFEEYFKIL